MIELFPSLEAKRCTKNLTSKFSTRWICLIKQLIFFDRQNHNERHCPWFIRLEFNTSTVWQRDCLWNWLNLMEFIQSKVWQLFDSLAMKNFNCGRRLQNPGGRLNLSEVGFWRLFRKLVKYKKISLLVNISLVRRDQNNVCIAAQDLPP